MQIRSCAYAGSRLHPKHFHPPKVIAPAHASLSFVWTRDVRERDGVCEMLRGAGGWSVQIAFFGALGTEALQIRKLSLVPERGAAAAWAPDVS
ncbi:hypothetical protein JYU34_003389 [Plutella xylostella]|uniref:Uncharacterized protein n=1 Tax=Plutella xylostella TaxID=51655 RepID=A0ABQ7QZX1_PLUXY|nr:hypothetical protein JYU34_003389 [Plutella xylostella]